MSNARLARRVGADLESSARPRFNALLRSRPIPLPYDGDLGRLAVVYNQSHCMSLDDDRPTLLGPMQKRVDSGLAQIADLFSAFNTTWDSVIARQRKGSVSPEERVQALVDLLINPVVPPAERLEQAFRQLQVETDPDQAGDPLTDAEEAAFKEAVTALETAVQAVTDEMDTIRLQIQQAVIGWVVVGIGVPVTKKDSAGVPHTTLTWPWDGPAPTPDAPESFGVLDEGHADHWVQRWIATEGVKEVCAAMRTPLFGI